MLKAKINITLKKTVADPQGSTIKRALESLGYKDLADARMGKLVTIRLNLRDKKRAEREVDQMCKRLLANPIIEDYHFTIKKE